MGPNHQTDLTIPVSLTAAAFAIVLFAVAAIPAKRDPTLSTSSIEQVALNYPEPATALRRRFGRRDGMRRQSCVEKIAKCPLEAANHSRHVCL